MLVWWRPVQCPRPRLVCKGRTPTCTPEVAAQVTTSVLSHKRSEVSYSLPVPPAAAVDLLAATAHAHPALDIRVTGTRVNVRVRTPLIGYATSFDGWLEPTATGGTRLTGRYVPALVRGGSLGVAVVYSVVFCGMLAYLVIAAWPPPSAALPFAGAVLVVIVTMILIALSA